MKHFSLLLISMLFLSLNAFGAGGGDQQKGHRKNDFFPKKPADKALSARPASAELLEPKAFSVVTGNQVTLKWQAAQGADSYRVQVATDPNFKWLVAAQDFVKETSFQVTGLQPGQQYFWRIYGMKPENETGFSSSFPSVSSFETK